MKLSLLDRYKIIKYAVKAALNPQTKMFLTYLEKHDDKGLVPYVVFPAGYEYTEPMFRYFGEIAGRSSTLELLNKRVANFNSLAADYFAEHTDIPRNQLGVLAKPVRDLKQETPAEEPTITINVKTE